MARLAFTGSPTLRRRGLLKALALLPAAALRPVVAEATDYADAPDVFSAIDRLEADVDARLRAIAREQPAAREFAQSVLEDGERHRRRRGQLRRQLGLAPAPEPTGPTSPDRTLEGLRSALEALAYAHAEGLPALGDPHAVDVLAHDMIDVSRQRTVVDLWISLEADRG